MMRLQSTKLTYSRTLATGPCCKSILFYISWYHVEVDVAAFDRKEMTTVLKS